MMCKDLNSGYYTQIVAYGIAQRTGADKVIAKHAKTAYRSIKNLPKTIRAKRAVKKLMEGDIKTLWIIIITTNYTITA